MAKDNHNSTVWQGYVAAIASLAQSMLFLMAVLTIALTQIAQQIGKDEASTKSVQSQLTNNSGASNSNLSNLPGDFSAHLKIVFVGNTLELDKEQRKKLAAALSSITLKPNEHWRIWAEYANGDALARRSGYLRILSIRSVMIGNGISDAKIEMNLIKREEVQGNSSEMNIFIDPVPNLGVSNR